MYVCVIGAGYVGLTTAAVLSDIGHNVRCVDKDVEKIENLCLGRVPVHEPGLSERIVKNCRAGRLDFSKELVESIEARDLIVIAVGTPSAANGSPDLTAIDEVTDVLARSIRSYTSILTKSTVPPGTNERIEQSLLEKGLDRALFDVIANPEFLQEGTAVHDSFHPNKIVVGTKNQKLVDTVRTLYQGIEAPYIVTTFEGAEMIKYASNAFLATKISFANELARICDAYHVNVQDVTRGLGTDPRIGPHFLGSGLGYGGSCLPKDLDALEHAALRKRVIPILLHSVKTINDSQVDLYTSKLKQALSGELQDKQITVWGLTFKPNTDDIRSSPAVRLAERLYEKGCRLRTYDPLAPRLYFEWVRSNDLYESLDGSDALVIATDWPEFVEADLQKVKEHLKGNLILDARNCLNADKVRSHGLRYTGVARG
ncbi:MAG TPA: UDP-glucose/GDP-mannose dehydrogenase family protein [Bacillales bacterium]|nr:UDP-glucose/GDP-mannose dehydrogenase family protein [Bacillales bacterium]